MKKLISLALRMIVIFRKKGEQNVNRKPTFSFWVASLHSNSSIILLSTDSTNCTSRGIIYLTEKSILLKFKKGYNKFINRFSYANNKRPTVGTSSGFLSNRTARMSVFKE